MLKGFSLLRWPVYRKWLFLYNSLKNLGVNPRIFLLSAFISFLAALADGVSIGLLIPTIQGVVGKSFLFVANKPFLRVITELLPPSLAKNNFSIFIFLILLIFFFALIKNVLMYGSSLITSYQVLDMAHKFRKLIFGRYLSFGKMFFDRGNFGHLQQALIEYTQQIAQQLTVIHISIFQFFSLLVYITIGLCISWKLMFFSAIIFPILHFSLQALIRKIAKSSEAFTKAYSEMSAKVSNVLSCMILIKANAYEEKEKESFNIVSERVRNLNFSISKKQLFINPFQEIVGLCVILLLIAYMSFLVIHDGYNNVAGFMVFFFVLRRASQYFGVFNLIQSSLAVIQGPLQKVQDMLDDKDKFFVPEGNKVFNGLKSKIEFKGLNFSYNGDCEILKDLNLSIRKGETIGIIGPSGSGKSTLIYILMRFYDISPGSLYLDGTDIREFTLGSLRNKIALVSQDTLLLNDSFKVNLLYGIDRKVSDTEIENVLKKARLLPLAQSIGLDAKIGERGVKLSGGERQRISIARAMLKDPEILILDEATNALDASTEVLVRAALEEIVIGKTIIIITHRLDAISRADRIVVLENGRILKESLLP